MKRDAIAPLALGCLVLGLLLAPGAAQEKPKPQGTPQPAETPLPTFPAQIELVNVDAVVTDKKGSSITGLTKDDFTVSEDGVRQAVTTFEAIVVPARPSEGRPSRPRVSTNLGIEQQTGRSFIVVFDDIHLTPFQAHRAKTAVAELLKNGVREGDVVTLVATGGGAWWTTRMEAGREDLLRLVKRLDGRHIPDLSPERITDYEAMRIHIYRDQQVAQRVQRRFETYGVSPNRSSDPSQNPYGAGEDPLVFGRAAEVYYQATAKNRITLEIVERILGSLTAIKGRKSLILVSEGFIYDPNLDDEFKRVVIASRRANVAIYFLDTRGLGGLPVTSSAQFGPPLPEQDLGAAFVENLEASEGAENIASETGGFSVKNTNDLGKGIHRIADESRAYYLLGYYSTNPKRDGKFRKIQVKLSRKGVEVRARRGYYAPLEGGKSVIAAKKGSDPAIQSALDSPYIIADVPLRMTEYVMDETILGKANVLVAAEADAADFGFEESEGFFLDNLDLLLVVAHHETGEYFTYPRQMKMRLLPESRERLRKNWLPLPLDQRFELSPGRYQAKLVVRDQNSGRLGTLFHEFEVPDLAALRVSTPILSDTLQPRSEGQRHPLPVALARRVFPAGATLYCQFEVFGAAKDKATGMPKVSAGYSIRRVDGTVASEVAPTVIQPTSLGGLSRLTGTSLASTIPGDYEFVLTVRDELAGKSIEVREPFAISVQAAAPGAGSQP